MGSTQPLQTSMLIALDYGAPAGPVPIGSAYNQLQASQACINLPSWACWCFLIEQPYFDLVVGGLRSSALLGWTRISSLLAYRQHGPEWPLHIEWYSKHCISQLCHVWMMLYFLQAHYAGHGCRSARIQWTDDDTPKSLDRMCNELRGFQRISH